MDSPKKDCWVREGIDLNKKGREEKHSFGFLQRRTNELYCITPWEDYMILWERSREKKNRKERYFGGWVEGG